MTEQATPSVARLHKAADSSFVRWYIAERPAEIIALYGRYARAFGEMFSFFFLLKTLFAPWKNIRDSYPSKGFNLSAILETWSANVTTRAIAACIRLAAIIAGICIQLAVFFVFFAYFVLWIAFPILFISGIPLLLALLLR